MFIKLVLQVELEILEILPYQLIDENGPVPRP